MCGESRRVRIAAAAVLVAMLCGSAAAYRSFQGMIPNGASVQRNGVAWPGVGHDRSTGGGPLNVFGAAFRDAGQQWTAALCAADSDGDGFSNGAELGDPDCAWSQGGTPARTTDISHPGFADSTPQTTTAAPPPPTTTTTTTSVPPSTTAAATTVAATSTEAPTASVTSTTTASSPTTTTGSATTSTTGAASTTTSAASQPATTADVTATTTVPATTASSSTTGPSDTPMTATQPPSSSAAAATTTSIMATTTPAVTSSTSAASSSATSPAATVTSPTPSTTGAPPAPAVEFATYFGSAAVLSVELPDPSDGAVDPGADAGAAVGAVLGGGLLIAALTFDVLPRLSRRGFPPAMKHAAITLAADSQVPGRRARHAAGSGGADDRLATPLLDATAKPGLPASQAAAPSATRPRINFDEI